MAEMIKDANDILDLIRKLKLENNKLNEIKTQNTSKITGNGLKTEEILVKEKNNASEKIEENLKKIEELQKIFFQLKSHVDAKEFKVLLVKYGAIFAETGGTYNISQSSINTYKMTQAINETTVRLRLAKEEIEKIEDKDQYIIKSAEIEYLTEALNSHPEGKLKLKLIEMKEVKRDNYNNKLK